MFKAEITTQLPINVVKEVFAHEDKTIQQRAEYHVETKGKETTFLIQAKDSVALRTTLNAIMRLLTTIEKTKEI